MKNLKPRSTARRCLMDRLEQRRLLCSVPHATEAPHIEELQFNGVASASSGPANIVWTNRGTSSNDSDRFNSVFGAAAETARKVIDAVIDHFERMVGSFNYSDGSSNFNLSLSMSSGGTSLGASASVQQTLNGKPKAGNVSMGRGNNGSGGGWFIDPTPNDNSEFLGTIVNAFSGNAQSGSPAAGLSDFYTVAAAEITHTLGLYGHSTSLPGWRNLVTDTGIADNAEGGGVGTFYAFRGPSIKHLLTSNNGGAGGSSFGGAIHSAGPNGNGMSFDGDIYIGAQDIGNAVYETSRRYIPNLAFALMFKDAYGFSTQDPSQFGTFYAALNDTTGQLTVRGGTTSHDTIAITHNAGTITVSVDPSNDIPGTGALPGNGNLPAFVSTFNTADVSAIVINTGDGNDTVTIDSLPAGVNLTMNTGIGNDVVNLGNGRVAGVAGQITLNDDFGVDAINVLDQDGTSNTTWEVSATQILRNGQPVATFGSFERMSFAGGSGNDTFDYANTSATLRTTIDGGGGNDVIRANETSSAVELTVLSSAGDDDVLVNTDGSGVARVLFTATGRFDEISIGQGGTAVLQAGGGRVLTVGSLAITGGTLDLKDNAMVVDYQGASPLAEIAALLGNGYAGGAWSGTGIVSANAASTPGTALGYAASTDLFNGFPASFAGQEVDSTAVLVRYTLIGDADLDKSVNIGDFSSLAAAFNAGAAGWSQGNFNFDGTVDIADFSLLASAFNNALPAGSTAAAEPAQPRAKSLFASTNIAGDDEDEPRLIADII